LHNACRKDATEPYETSNFNSNYHYQLFFLNVTFCPRWLDNPGFQPGGPPETQKEGGECFAPCTRIKENELHLQNACRKDATEPCETSNFNLNYHYQLFFLNVTFCPLCLDNPGFQPGGPPETQRNEESASHHVPE